MPKLLVNNTPDEAVTFSLELEGGKVFLYANGSSVLDIDETGLVSIHTEVPNELGFDTNDYGQLFVDDSVED